MTSAFFAIGLLFALLAAGQQVAIAIGIVAVTILLFTLNIPVIVLSQVAFSSLDSYALLAIPFFLLAGRLATDGNIAELIFDTLGTVLRCIPGGMAVSLLISAVFFSAINGSSVACAAALGPAATRILPAEGYPKRFAAALVAVGGTLGTMLPPSLSFILIGAMVQLPVSELFIAGILPGLLEAGLLAITVFWMSKRHNYGIKQKRPDWRAFRRHGSTAFPALLMPLLIVGGIYAGVMTPTEISSFAVAYAALLGLVIYKTLSVGAFWGSVKDSLLQTVMIFAIVMSGTLLSFLLIRLGLSSSIAAALTEAGVDTFWFLIIVNLLLLFLGCIFDGISLVVLTGPILFPIAIAFGIDPIHFAVIMTACVEIATITPPIGMNLYVMSQITNIRVESIVKAVSPFYAVRIVGLILINAFPGISLWLLGG